MNGPVTPESLHARNEALLSENERLSRALNQAVTHARPELPTPQDRAKLQLSEDSVLFHAFGGYREWHECPELAAHLRSMEGHR